jgi:hypothetical protein
MKLDLAIHSSDSNPFYLDFWPLVSKAWKVKFGITPLLVYIDENHDIPIDTTYGPVIKMKPIPGIPVYLQCLWVRYWIPSQYPDKVSILCDIDMFPISKKYFIDSIRNVPTDKYVHTNPNHEFLPSCYHIALGSNFVKVLNLDPSWETSIRSLHAMNIGHDSYTPSNPILKGKLQWGADEEYATRRLREYPDQSLFVYIPRTHDRIDRSHWVYSSRDIQLDRYADAHSIRPYSTYKALIDKLMSELLS